MMSREELHQFVIDAEAKLASQAMDVTPAGEAPGEDESDDAPLPPIKPGERWPRSTRPPGEVARRNRWSPRAFSKRSYGQVAHSARNRNRYERSE
jgi:hypothetical protein